VSKQRFFHSQEFPDALQLRSNKVDFYFFIHSSLTLAVTMMMTFVFDEHSFFEQLKQRERADHHHHHHRRPKNTTRNTIIVAFGIVKISTSRHLITLSRLKKNEEL
jgi:hypothetical protein